MINLNLNAKPYEPKKKLQLPESVTNIEKFDFNTYLDKFHSLENNESFLTDEQIMNLYQKYHEFQTSNYQYIEENIFFDNDKECSICLQNILENNRRFGLLLNCTHVFCLDCIKQWRRTHLTNAKKEFHRLCPNCKIESYYVIPSNIFIDNYFEKKKLANDYKLSMGKIECKYVKNGIDGCPFGSSCFYIHTDQSGNKMDYDTLMISSDGKLIKHEKYYSDYFKELMRHELN